MSTQRASVKYFGLDKIHGVGISFSCIPMAYRTAFHCLGKGKLSMQVLVPVEVGYNFALRHVDIALQYKGDSQVY